MQCPTRTGEGVEVILAYLGGKLSDARKTEIEAHLEECQPCQELLLAQSVVFDAMDAWKPAPISADFDHRVQTRIQDEESRSGWWRALFRPVLPFSLKPALAVATFCLLLVAGLLLRPRAQVDTGGVAQVEPVDIEQFEQAVEDLEMLYLLDPTLTEDEGAETAEPEDAAGAGVVQLLDSTRTCG